jgi:hypothetical protein
MHSRDKTADVMAENLAQGFVDLRSTGLASHLVSELGFNHVECGFDVRALVITRHELLLVVRKVVEHLTPQGAVLLTVRAVVYLEGNKRHRVVINYRLEIVIREIGFVGRDFIHHKASGGSLNKRLKEGAVCRVTIRDFDGGHNVCFHSAHDMYFQPVLRVNARGVVTIHSRLLIPLRLEPSAIHASGDAGAINGKVSFDSRKRQTGFFNKHLQVGCESFRFKVIEDAVVAGQSGDVAFAVRVRLRI